MKGYFLIKQKITKERNRKRKGRKKNQIIEISFKTYLISSFWASFFYSTYSQNLPDYHTAYHSEQHFLRLYLIKTQWNMWEGKYKKVSHDISTGRQGRIMILVEKKLTTHKTSNMLYTYKYIVNSFSCK